MTGRGRSRADLIRQAWADPAVKAGTDQSAAAGRDQAGHAKVKKIRSLAAKARKGGAELDELGLDALAADIAKLITLDPVTNTAIIRELLPAYVSAQRSS